MVGHGAGILVLALDAIQLGPLASLLPLTGILGAVVAVLADAHRRIHRDVVRLIGITVAIIIFAVAHLLARRRGVAGRETLPGADPNARADSPLIAHLAGGPEAQLHRAVAARTGPGISHTLGQQDPLVALHLLAGEAPRTLLALRLVPAGNSAGSATKTALVAIDETVILDSPGADAVFTAGARAAQGGKIGNAGEGQIGTGARHLVTTPSRRTILLAEPGADKLPQMTYAPTRLAIAVLVALVEEAAFAGQTPETLVLQHRLGHDTDLGNRLTAMVREDNGLAGHIRSIRAAKVRRGRRRKVSQRGLDSAARGTDCEEKRNHPWSHGSS